MKTLTVRLPEALVADIEAESRGRKISKSDVVRERLRVAGESKRRSPTLDAIADLIGSVDGLPADLSGRKKRDLSLPCSANAILITGGPRRRPSSLLLPGARAKPPFPRPFTLSECAARPA